jgi:hypothetical protein
MFNEMCRNISYDSFQCDVSCVIGFEEINGYFKQGEVPVPRPGYG